MRGRPLQPPSGVPPLIGITSSELRRKEQVEVNPHGEPPQTELALGLSYPEALRRVGGLPVILAPVADGDASALVGRLDGLVLSGGPDLDPRTYGQTPHEHLGPTEPSVDEFELALCAAAVSQGLPVLGICRGLQVLNVAAGGTLHQHLPDAMGATVGHRQREAGRLATHVVTVEPSSRLAAWIGAEPLVVNSFHHQGVDVVAPGLRAVAHAPDGLIEALEGAGPGILLGVQWHAESLTEDDRHRALFEALAGAARERGVVAERPYAAASGAAAALGQIAA